MTRTSKKHVRTFYEEMIGITVVLFLLLVSSAVVMTPSFSYSYSSNSSTGNNNRNVPEANSLGEVYVSGGSTNVTVINGTNIIASIQVGYYPSAQLAYAPNVEDVFVPVASGTVSVISVKTNKVVDTITGFKSPVAALYVPLNKAVYLSDWSARKVYAINTTTLSVFAKIAIPECPSQRPAHHKCQPWFMAYSSATQELYVVDFNSCSSCDYGNVTIINPLTNKVVGSLPALYEAAGIGFDPANNDIYVANPGETWVFNAKNQLVTILANPDDAYNAFAYNSNNKDLYAVNDAWPYAVYLIEPNNSVVGIVRITHLRLPNGIAYDPSNKLIYATAYSASNGSEWVLIINGTKKPTYIRCDCFWGIVAS